MTYHLLFIASNSAGSYTKSIRRSPPHPHRVVGGDAQLFVSYRQEIWKETCPRGHGHVGELGEHQAVPRATWPKGSNPLKRLIDLRMF